MAESYSVKAILSATDRGFTSTLKNALHSVTSFAKSVGSGMLMGAGMAAFNALAGGARDLVSEIDSSNASWKTFESNLSMLNWDEGSITSAKKELQSFAQKTVYSSSDMATTFSQLAAVGVKDTSQLVQAFGGLAAAAENPQQAMKTLSQQATQMAAKPNVAWADFKLMLEQTPAGIAAVAREMGMTTSELVTAVQDGEVATNDFFDAIKKAGGAGTDLAKLATEAKTVGQAMDGLKETLGNKLTPAFDILSKIGIKAVDGIANKLSKIDGEKIASKLSGWIKKAKPYFDDFASAARKVWSIFTAIGKEVAPLFSALKSKVGGAVASILEKIKSINVHELMDNIRSGIAKAQPYFDLIKSAVATLSGAIQAAIPYVVSFAKAIGGFLLDNAETICNVIKKATPIVLGLVGAFKGYKIISSLVPGMSSFAKSIATMASGGIKGLASKLFGVAAGQTASGKAAASSSKQMLASAKAFMMIGAGVLMIAGGFALLAQSAIALSNAGGLAIGVMAGLVIAVAALSIGMMAMMKTVTTSPAKLTAMSTAMLALGAAVVLIGVGFALMAQSSIALANAGGLAIGVMVGMVATVALLAIGAAALGTALTAGAVGFIAFGAAIVLVGVGAVIAGAALAIVAAVLPTICTYGLQGATAIAALGASMIVFAVGAATAGAASLVLAAGLTAVGLSVGVCAVGVAALAVAVVALGAGCLVLGAALVIVTAALTAQAVLFPAVATGALLVVAGFTALLALSAGLSVGLVALTASIAALSVASAAGAVAIAAFGVAVAAAAVGVVAMGAALKAVKSSMKSIAKDAKAAEKSLDSMQDSVDIVQSGLDALGSKAKETMDKLGNAFDDAAKKAKQSGKELGTGFTNGMKTGLNQAPAAAQAATSQVSAALHAGQGPAYTAGAYISIGFANGMLSQLAVIRNAANQMAAQAQRALEAKAKIASPSKVTTKDGQWWGQGYANGILDKIKTVEKAAEELISAPNVTAPKLALAYGGELSSDYSYFGNRDYTIEVPLSVDGKEFAKATAQYTQSELDKRQARDRRKHGEM